MFAARRVAARVASTTVAPTTAVGAQVRSVSGSSSAAASLYRLVFKRNATYVAFVIGGAMVGGCVYDKFMDSVFVAYNQGRLYETIDWSEWKSPCEDDDDDDDDDDDEDEDEDEDDE